MKKIVIASACAAALGFTSINVHAALLDGSTLSIESGSFFNLLGVVSTIGVNGIVVGSVQPSDFSSSGSEIDQFIFIGSPGMHYTTSPVNVISSTANTASLDFSGWSWAFNGGLVSFNLGTGAWGTNPEGVAQITCGFDCSNGDTYTLAYTATVPADEPSGYAGLSYELYLTGNISAVPVPAAVWLFGSGLIGLAGVARCRKKA